VCRVFKKCQIIKVRPPTDSPTMVDSPCHDGNTSLGELDVSSILGNLTTPASGHTSSSSPGDGFGHRVDMSAYMAWMAAANQGAAAMIPWATAPGLFGNVFPTPNQLGQRLLPYAGGCPSHQPRDIGGITVNVVGGDHAMFGSSVAKVDMECDQQQPPEQQLGMDDSIWRAF
jgi:hypothetical protein